MPVAMAANDGKSASGVGFVGQGSQVPSAAAGRAYTPSLNASTATITAITKLTWSDYQKCGLHTLSHACGWIHRSHTPDLPRAAKVVQRWNTYMAASCVWLRMHACPCVPRHGSRAASNLVLVATGCETKQGLNTVQRLLCFMMLLVVSHLHMHLNTMLVKFAIELH